MVILKLGLIRLVFHAIKANLASVAWNNNYSRYKLAYPFFDHDIVYIPQWDMFANPTDPATAFGKMDDALHSKFVLVMGEHSYTRWTQAEDYIAKRYIQNYEEQVVVNKAKKSALHELEFSVKGKGTIKLTDSLSSYVRRSLMYINHFQALAEREMSGSNYPGSATFKPTNPYKIYQPFNVDATFSSKIGNGANGIAMRIPEGLDYYPASLLSGVVSEKSRKYSIVVGAKTLVYNYKLHAPAGFHWKGVPKNHRFVNMAGSYTSYYRLQGNTIIVNRIMAIKQTVYSAKEFPALKTLVQNGLDDMQQSVMLSNPSLPGSVCPN